MCLFCVSWRDCNVASFVALLPRNNTCPQKHKSPSRHFLDANGDMATFLKNIGLGDSVCATLHYQGITLSDLALMTDNDLEVFGIDKPIRRALILRNV